MPFVRPVDAALYGDIAGFRDQQGNAENPDTRPLRERERVGSTLRLTLGVLLSDRLGIALRREGTRHTFGTDGETRLSLWMGDHARVAWYLTPEPWDVEPIIIRSVSLPLNLRGNESHPFHATLSSRRSLARALARDWDRSSRPREP